MYLLPEPYDTCGTPGISCRAVADVRLEASVDVAVTGWDKEEARINSVSNRCNKSPSLLKPPIGHLPSLTSLATARYEH